MPLLLDTDTRTGTLVAAINHVLVLHGPTGLTMRRIAQVSGVSTSSMLHHLGSREHLIRVAASQTASARRQDLESRVWRDGPLAFLPETGDQVLDARAWLAWQEMWRSEEFLDKWITRARADERGLLAHVLDFQLARDDLDATIAMIDGLTVAVCAPTAPLRIDRARQILTRHLARLGVEANHEPSTHPGPGRGVTPALPRVSSW